MKNEVFVIAPMLNAGDMESIQGAPYAADAEFKLIEEQGAFDTVLGECTFRCDYVLAKDGGYKAAFELIKCSILDILKKVDEKISDDEDSGIKLHIEVCEKDGEGREGKRNIITMSTSHMMKEAERERIINKCVGYLLLEAE